MELFTGQNKAGKNEVEEPHVKSYVVRTNNVAKELVLTSKKYKVPISQIDFSILDVQTFVRKQPAIEGAAEADWAEVDPANLLETEEEINDEAFLLNPEFQIKQLYEIEIKSVKPDSPFANLKIVVSGNKSLTKTYVTFKKGSKVSYFEKIIDELVNFINKKKLRANLLIGLWDSTLRKDVKTLIAKVQVAETMKFNKNITFISSECLDISPTIDDELHLLYEQKSDNKDEFDRVDYSKRGFIKSVKKDEILIEYIKPKAGTHGRSCRGEYIPASEPAVKNEPKFGISDKIERQESDTKVEFYAKVSGYITYENNTYDINEELDVDEISFKTTGSVNAGGDTDVTINVKQTDVFKDAIGMGMVVDAKEVNVDGNIGPNATVKGQNIRIDGQTHQSSKVSGDKININVHKGFAKGKEVYITRLESGIVEGDIVNIKQAIGGKVRAREVYFEVMGSNVSVVASKKIELKSLKGEENELAINPFFSDEEAERIGKVKEELVLSKKIIRDMKEEVESRKALVLGHKKAYDEIKKRISTYKKSGVSLPSSFMKKIKEYQEAQKFLLGLQQELQGKEERHIVLQKERDNFQKVIFAAQVINHSPWRGHNIIKFSLIHPNITLEHKPFNKAKEELFMLELVEGTEDDYKIAVKKLNEDEQSHES